MKKQIYFCLLALVGPAIGCTKKLDSSVRLVPIENETRHSNNRWIADHTHGDGPHNGTIVNWDGGKFHLELVIDHENNEAIVYILGNDEKSQVASSAKSMEVSVLNPPMHIVLKPVPQNGDPTGTASCFKGKHKNLNTFREFEGKISGSVDNVPFSRDFVELAHSDHESDIN